MGDWNLKNSLYLPISPRRDLIEGRCVSASSLAPELALLTRQAKAKMFIEERSTQNGHKLPTVGTDLTCGIRIKDIQITANYVSVIWMLISLLQA